MRIELLRQHPPPSTAVLAAIAAVILLCASGCSTGHTPSSPAPASRGAHPDATPTRTAAPATATAGSTPPALLPARPPAGTPVRVIIGREPVGPTAPADFLGLSFEMRSLPSIARYAEGRPAGENDDTGPAAATPAAPGDLVGLLRSLGPGVLRFGGVSADEEVAWSEPGTRKVGARPPWARVAITPGDLAGLARLARQTGWKVLLTVNLGHYDPAAAAREAAAAHAALGPYLLGIEIGNEPDHYARKHQRPPGWDFAAYLAQADAYRAAIERAAPSVAIAGPDPSTGPAGLAWVRATARTLRPALLTDHYYPLSSCGYRPTIGEVLSPRTVAHGNALLARAVAIARRAHMPLRIDEANSVSCEGLPGVSDTFASALWALEYIARALHAGAAGVNLHDLIARPHAYSPLYAPDAAALAAGRLHAAPEYYALLAARELPGSRPLPLHIAGAAPGELGASAFRAPHGLVRLVLIDYDPPGSPPLALRLPGLRARAGAVLRLTAPAPAATAGVTLAGRAVAADGSWTPPGRLPALYRRRGTLSLQLDPSSAAVVTLYPG